MSERSAKAREEPAAETDRAVLGAEIRKLRKARGKSIAEAALAIGRSISFVSQLERGNAEASIADLRGIAKLFDVSLGWFFVGNEAPQGERGRVVRVGSRRQLGSTTTGLVEELLSPDISGAFEIFLDTFAPGSERSVEARRDTEEQGYIIKGVLDMWINGDAFRLGPGDSFRIVREPYRWANRGTEDVLAIWVIAPPTY